MQTQSNTFYNGTDELLNLEFMENYNTAIVDDSVKVNKKVKLVVDFGAGIGTLSNIFRYKYKINTTCIEIDKKNIKFLKKRSFNYFEDISYLSNKADLIFSSNVLEHIKNDLQILISFRNKLKENGYIYLFLPAKKILWTKLDEVVGHYRRYEISDVKRLCKKSGYKIHKLHYADSIGFLTTLIWKFLNYFNKKSFPSKSSLIFYDRYIFPLSRILDKFGFKYLIGKNIVLLASKN